VLSILVIVGVLVGVAGLLIPRVAGGDDLDAERKAVISRASDFAVTYNTYEVAKKSDYQRRMKGLLTPSYFKEFTTVTNALFQALEAKGQKSDDAKVLDVAIDSIDKDSAIALVAVDANITTSQEKGAVARRFRWKVTFAQQKGTWLVRQFETVATLEATTGDPTATPSPSPSQPSPSPSQESGQ
jgi:hypothetical protein